MSAVSGIFCLLFRKARSILDQLSIQNFAIADFGRS